VEGGDGGIPGEVIGRRGGAMVYTQLPCTSNQWYPWFFNKSKLNQDDQGGKEMRTNDGRSFPALD
jgi:hypothetical protein